MDQNPYESPRHAGTDRPSTPPKPKKARWYEYVVVIVIVVVMTYLLVPAVIHANRSAKEKRAFDKKYMRDPKTGHFIPRDQAETSDD
jgi:hypothetical protein